MFGNKKRPPQRGSIWRQVMIFAPVILQILSSMRQAQKKKRGYMGKVRKREKAFDFVLDQANRWVNGRGRRRF